ncbi:MAG: DUF5320 family protein [Ignavibacteriales bacterium]|jgi:hypothetical protein|nr:DUF5320 family protein [Ignavibacteriales bacterium]MBP9121214.1 DUF5320 family protein [Ignavibacterium sp.]
MPNLDGTGPKGQRAMNGKRKGICKDTKATQVEKSENQTTQKNEVDEKPGNGGKGNGQGRRKRFGRNHSSDK